MGEMTLWEPDCVREMVASRVAGEEQHQVPTTRCQLGVTFTSWWQLDATTASHAYSRRQPHEYSILTWVHCTPMTSRKSAPLGTCKQQGTNRIDD